MEAGRSRRWRNRRGSIAVPARARGRIRRLGEELVLQRLHDDEGEDEEPDGLAGGGSRARWPRCPRRCAPAASLTTAKSSNGGRKDSAGEGKWIGTAPGSVQ